MCTWNQWTCGVLFTVVCVAPALARPKHGDDTKPANAAVNAEAESSSPPSASAPLNAARGNITALLGVLVMKGVLSPAEANAIRDAAPDAEFQMLVEALARKGVVSRDELAPALHLAVKAVEPAQAAQTPAAASKPAAPKVIPAVAALRVLQLEPAKPDGMIPDLKLGSGARLKLYGLVKAA